MKQLSIKLYYAAIVLVSLGFAAHTVFIGSAHIANGQKVAELEKRSAVLSERQVTLHHQMSQQTAFATLASVAEQQGFTSTQQVIQLPALTQVASR